jgi:maltose alpha-D-glucosyltransferase/alpha-amylase
MTAAPPDPGPTASKLWYRDAVIYQLHVKSFQDGNDDGIGDFPGLLSRIDYLASLGVDALWLLPFYPSPRRDDGYDVADYLGVAPDYGTPDDVGRLLEAAHARGLRVLGDLVLNHTSDRHPWFERARRAPRDSEEHQFYVWSDTDQAYAGTRIIFPDVEKSNWTWDPVAGRYFFHRFYSHQPDLNYENPRVLEEMLQVLRYWLDRGFDGFRLDAVAYLAEEEGSSNENLPKTHAVLKRLRAEIDAHYPDRILLAEANQWPEDMKEYFGNDDECHMAFHFPLMPRMYMAVAQEDRFPITDILAQTPPTPPNSQWAIFLRNHDELTLEMVTDAERDYLWQTYAADPRARLNLGIRRRLAPLLQRDRRRIELMTALLLTLPGTPVIYYGDEIGMGDNIHLGDRDGVRTPMQWSIDRNGGFSRADAQRLVLPTLIDPLYGYPSVNVETQERDPHSLLHWVRGMLRMRRRYPSLFGSSGIRFLACRNRKALVFVRENHEAQVLCIANLSRSMQAVELDLGDFEGRVPLDMLGGAALPAVAAAPYLFTLPPYGFYTLELVPPDRLPDGYVAALEPSSELPTLVLRHALADELQTGLFDRLKAQGLAAWLRKEGWTPRVLAPDQLVLAHASSATQDDHEMAALELIEDGLRGAPLMLATVWQDAPDFAQVQGHALARVRRGSRLGVLVEALRVPGILRAWVKQWQAEPARPESRLAFDTVPGAAFPLPRTTQVDAIAEREGMLALRVDASVMLTFARGASGSLAEPLELVRYLSRQKVAQSLRLVGELRVASTESAVFAFAQAWRSSRGDAAQWTVDFLQRALHDYRAAVPERRAELLKAFLPTARLLGSRLARLHRALAGGFGPPIGDAGEQGLVYRRLAAGLAGRLLRARTRLRDELGIDTRALAPLGRRIRELERRVATADPPEMMRIHGDAVLKNIQLTVDDAFFINFSRPRAELRGVDGESAAKLVDVAALLYGFSHSIAILQHLAGDSDAVPDEFAARFVDRAKRSAVKRYQRVWKDDPDARLGASEKGWIELLMLDHAIREIETAPQRGALAVAWLALRAR